MKPKKTIIITGTQIAPAIELITQLQQDPSTDWQIHYLGRKYTSPIQNTPAIEAEIIPKMGVTYHLIDCGKLDRRYLPNTIMGLPKTIKGIFQALYYIFKIKPSVVVSFGGYLSVPVILAAFINKIPSITHEQTSTNSLSTKINSRFATKVALSFDNRTQINSLPSSKVAITGNLLRRSIYDSSSKLFNKLINHPKLPIIFITAGNQGSHTINSLILKVLDKLTPKYIVIHQTGKLEFDRIKNETRGIQNYYLFDYILPKDIGWVFKNTSLIISRSGANSTQEFAQFGHKTILIPLPFTQQNEQELNAKWLKSLFPRRVIILNDLSLTPFKLLKAIKKLSQVKIKKSSITPQPNLKLLQLIYEIC